MRLSLLASALCVTLVSASGRNRRGSTKRFTRRSDDVWDHIVSGADVASKFSQSITSTGSSSLANYHLRAKAVDPSLLGVDTVKQYSGYLDNDAEDKHLFYCKSEPSVGDHRLTDVTR